MGLARAEGAVSPGEIRRRMRRNGRVDSAPYQGCLPLEGPSEPTCSNVVPTNPNSGGQWT